MIRFLAILALAYITAVMALSLFNYAVLGGS